MNVIAVCNSCATSDYLDLTEPDFKLIFFPFTVLSLFFFHKIMAIERKQDTATSKCATDSNMSQGHP